MKNLKLILLFELIIIILVTTIAFVGWCAPIHTVYNTSENAIEWFMDFFIPWEIVLNGIGVIILIIIYMVDIINEEKT